MDNKILTITIPAYNSERFIARCLDSFIEDSRIDERLDIIIVNDGSKDGTAKAAEEYQARYPDSVRVVNKENGGHGSGINTGIEYAKGRFFKVVDSDDRVVTANIKSVLDILETTDSDAVVTGYLSINEKNGKIQKYPAGYPEEKNEGKFEYSKCVKLDFENFAGFFEKIPASFQFHGLCYKTDFYRQLGIRLTEHVSYEDQEYAVLPFIKVRTVTMIPHFFYIYRLGAEGQSVSYANMSRQLNNMRTVLEKMISCHLEAAKGPDWSAAREKFFTKRLSIAAASCYAAAMVKSEDKAGGRREAEKIRAYLFEHEPEIAANVEKRYNILLKASKIPGLAGIYSRFSDSGLYMRFKRIWVK